MTTVTRTLIAEPHRDLASITRTIGKMRTDISHRYGALTSTRDELIRFKSECAERYGHLAVDGTIRNQTIIDTQNEIKAAREAAKVPVKRAIVIRTEENEEGAIRLSSFLNRNKWTRDSFLHSQMRKHFRHGQNPGYNQFFIRSDKHSETVIDGKLVVTIHITAKHGNDIRLATNATGEGIELTDDNLQIVPRDGFVEIHYDLRKGPGRICGSVTISVDEGHTETLADSDGHFHRHKFGKIVGNFTKMVHDTSKNLIRLKTLVQKHCDAGRTAKADRILQHNLEKKKLDRHRMETQTQLRTEAFQAAHAVVDKESVVVAEDLTSVIARQKSWGRGFSRCMGFWAKGVLAEALESVTKQRSANLVLVNAAYISQTNSRTGYLEGKRQGDRFITPTGEVLHSDVNAARNVRDPIHDSEITRYLPFDKVRKIFCDVPPGEYRRLIGPSRVSSDTSTGCGYNSLLGNE